MKKYTIATILISAILGIVFILGILNTNEYRSRIAELEENNQALESMLDQKDFAYTTASMEIDNLEQVIADKDELILQLQVKAEVLELYKKTLEYTYTYVYYAQALMDNNRISYAEFIGETILEDDYFEELEDQVEWFEGVE